MALIVVTGGARCGKSGAAERLAYRRHLTGVHVVVAVFGNPDGDDVEFAERIRHHKENRPEDFDTLESFDRPDWLDAIRSDDLLIIDSLGTALSAIMATAEERDNASDRIDDANTSSVEEDFCAMVRRILSREGDTIVVCNEVGSGLVPEWESGRLYRDLLSRANRQLVSAADSSYLCVCGRLVDLGMLPTDMKWPED